MILIGAGGHARSVYDILLSINEKVDAYVDDAEPFISWPKMTEEQLLACVRPEMALSFAGIDPEDLERRYNLLLSYEEHFGIGTIFPYLVHRNSCVSIGAARSRGCQVMASSTVNYGAFLGVGCIINTGAIVEHNVTIGNGSHIAPGAVVLGGAKVGDFCFVGANVVVVQGSEVPDRTFVKAGSVWKNKK